VLPHTPIILIVVDDRSVQAALAEALQLDDHPLLLVASVAEAEDALQRLGSAGIKPVLIDIHLTAGLQTYEGYQLYERWHRCGPPLAPLYERRSRRLNATSYADGGCPVPGQTLLPRRTVACRTRGNPQRRTLGVLRRVWATLSPSGAARPTPG